MRQPRTPNPSPTRCIRHSGLSYKGLTWCGWPSVSGAFPTIDFAAYASLGESALQICPACVDAIKLALDTGVAKSTVRLREEGEE